MGKRVGLVGRQLIARVCFCGGGRIGLVSFIIIAIMLRRGAMQIWPSEEEMAEPWLDGVPLGGDPVIDGFTFLIIVVLYWTVALTATRLWRRLEDKREEKRTTQEERRE